MSWWRSTGKRLAASMSTFRDPIRDGSAARPSPLWDVGRTTMQPSARQRQCPHTSAQPSTGHQGAHAVFVDMRRKLHKCMLCCSTPCGGDTHRDLACAKDVKHYLRVCRPAMAVMLDCWYGPYAPAQSWPHLLTATQSVLVPIHHCGGASS